RPVGDPHLPAAEYPRVAVALRARAQLRRVASDLGLGEAEAADDLALAQRGKPPLLLLLRAEFEDGHLDERDLDGERRAHRRVRAPDLLGDEGVRDEVETDATVFLRHRSAEQTERRHLSEHVLGEDLAPIALARSRRDLLVREILRELADRLLLGSEVEVHAAPRPT